MPPRAEQSTRVPRRGPLTRHRHRRRALTIGAAVLLAAGSAVGLNLGQPAEASTTDAAFNSGTGALNVDYAGYLSKHDVVYNSPNTNPLYGLTVGNGRTGAMVWSQNGLTMQVSGVDLSEQSAFAAGQRQPAAPPRPWTPATARYQQRLSLYDGTLTTKYDTNRTRHRHGRRPNSEVMGIHVDDTRTGVSSVTLDLSLWDLEHGHQLRRRARPEHLEDRVHLRRRDRRRVQPRPDRRRTTSATRSRRRSRAPRTPRQVVNGTQVRLTITPTSSYTIWFTAAQPDQRRRTTTRSPQARNQLAAGQVAPATRTTLDQLQELVARFWAKSFVQYSNAAGDADYLENVYYLATYMIAAGGYGNYPFHFINGVFRATQDTTKWSNAYWYWNQRDVYNSFLASQPRRPAGHLQQAVQPQLQRAEGVHADPVRHRRRCGCRRRWAGTATPAARSAATTPRTSCSTGTEAAYNMYLQYRYTNDTATCSNTAYPFMREVVKFYAAKLSNGRQRQVLHGRLQRARDLLGRQGRDHRPGRRPAAVPAGHPGQHPARPGRRVRGRSGRTSWTTSCPTRCPTGHTCRTDPPVAATRNDENVASELIWPYDRTGIGAADYQTAVNTWNARPFPYGNVWANDAIQAARLGLGDQAFDGMKTMLQKYQNYPNGMTNNTNGVFEYLGVHLAAMNESLLQSYNDKIRVFPAVPSDSSFVGKFTLLAKDGFLVSSEREAGEIKYVGLKSLYGKQATRRQPVGRPVGPGPPDVRQRHRHHLVGRRRSPSATAANTVYVVERTAKPLSAYSSTTLTGTANQGQKSLRNTASTLGTGAPTWRRRGHHGQRHRADLRHRLVPHQRPRVRRLQRRHPPHQHGRGRRAVHVHRHRRGLPVRTQRRHGQRRRVPRQRPAGQRQPLRRRRPAGAADGVEQDRPGQRLAHHPDRQQVHRRRHGRRAADLHRHAPPAAARRCGRTPTAGTSPPAVRR